ncbi:uncharacterized protein HMPREF1541_09872 [Cyphellophora europaea CBS 101466]|uniref:Uncharacterized protein n=1 Tax=Cyphellophora europaea (strain CBS 101466) TaxID=1220924 RepID=W2S8G3_CYPE1|nr:uncharacterized protein HMPREF1541_09872 [Cyphellophora europaea CBS 101466]ETN44996.1 hypothetical protein HMPREF1541_09872 [Cyphellophora europaea CBS 101466]
MGLLSKATAVVLVTGANQGIGFEIVKKLATEQPNFHIFLASRSHANGQKAVATLPKLAEHTSVEALELDVNHDTSITKAVQHLEAHHGRLDVLINNAGIMSVDGVPFRDNMRQVMETNAISAACVTEAFLPLMKKADQPRLLFTSSEWGSITYCLDASRPFHGYDAKPYFTSKAAMNMVGAQYAVQLGKEGFKVNIVSPGFRSTNLTGFHPMASHPSEGALEICRLAVDLDKDGQHGVFSEWEGRHPW